MAMMGLWVFIAYYTARGIGEFSKVKGENNDER